MTHFPSHMRQWTHPGIIVSIQSDDEFNKMMAEGENWAMQKGLKNFQLTGNFDAKEVQLELYNRRLKKYVTFSEEGLSEPSLYDQVGYNHALDLADAFLKKGIRNSTVNDVENLFKKMHAKMISDLDKRFHDHKGKYRSGDMCVRRVPCMFVYEEFETYLKANDPQSLPFLYHCKPLLDKGFEYSDIARWPSTPPKIIQFINKYLYQAPSADKVQKAMRDMIETVQAGLKEKDSIELAGFAFMQFVNIHPFADANGRIARIFMNMILIEGGHQPIAFSYDSDYSKAVAEDQKKNNGAFTRYIRPTVEQFDYEALDSALLDSIKTINAMPGLLKSFLT